jgi:hypothetical protein
MTDLERKQLYSRKITEILQCSVSAAGYILAKPGFKQWKIAIDNGWPVLYSGFDGGA